MVKAIHLNTVAHQNKCAQRYVYGFFDDMILGVEVETPVGEAVNKKEY